MEKIWAGRSTDKLNKDAEDFNTSLPFDKKLYRQDIKGSIAHATMLSKCGIIDKTDGEKIVSTLKQILSEIEEGKLVIEGEAEDIHSFVEQTLTERIGDAGKKLHTARSRNDQVAVDFKMYVIEKAEEVKLLLLDLIKVLNDKASENLDAIMPGYTHLQRAQPITFAHHLLAYASMFVRDYSRLTDAIKRMSVCPLGSGALAGTTYPIDRQFTAELLGFETYSDNSIDGVSDRDFCVEALSSLSIISMHLSRLSEEVILWTSWEFAYVELTNEFTTGSSIMPQKKNSDMAELIRGKSGRVYGDLFTMLTVLKGLPLAYNKDLQEDKECVFDAFETVINCLKVCAPMLATCKVKKENMLSNAKKGFINATDVADYLTKKGMPFRTAYKITGTIVKDCIQKGVTLEDLKLEEFKEYSELFDFDIYTAIDFTECVNKRLSGGGTSQVEDEKYIKKLNLFLKQNM